MYQVWALSFTGCFLGLVHASPAYLQTSSNFLIPRNGTDPIKAVCPFPLDDMNPATAQAAWANSGADAYLEKFLEPQNELNWYQNLWAKIHHGDNVAYPCQDVLGTCAIVPTDCGPYSPPPVFSCLQLVILTTSRNLCQALPRRCARVLDLESNQHGSRLFQRHDA